MLKSEYMLNVGSLKVGLIPITFNDTNLKEIYKKLKLIDKEVDISIIDSRLILSIQHIIGILRIINEEKKRKNGIDIKNIEIEILMRFCYTDQISEALKINFDDILNRNFIVIVISSHDKILFEVEHLILDNGFLNEEILKNNTLKKEYIIDKFFKKKSKDLNMPIFKDDGKFLGFVLERGAIALK